MQYAYLGRTGLQVSRVCLGTMNFGPRTSPEDSFEIMDRALDVGINFFDTANVYGGSEKGLTESIIGDWLAQGGRREKIVLATKVYGAMSKAMNDSKLSAYNIKRACEMSLKRLKTDHIDLYQMHHIDRNTPWEEIWQAMDQLRREGKISYVGSSNFAGWHIATACQEASLRSMMGLVSEQSLYNLRERTVELEVLPACKHYGVGLIAWSPLAGGMLGGVLKHEAGEGERRSGDHVPKRIEERRSSYEAYEALCAEIGQKPGVVANAWLMAQEGVTGPIIGPRTLEQMLETAESADVILSEETLTRLDEIWPGPGAPAPEAYAW